MGNNWKTFYLDTNAVWGLIESEEQWEKIVKETGTMPGFRGTEDARRHLLSTRRYTTAEFIMFGFPLNNPGETLAEFLAEINE